MDGIILALVAFLNRDLLGNRMERAKIPSFHSFHESLTSDFRGLSYLK